MEKVVKVMLSLLVCIHTAACAATARITVKVVEEDTGKPLEGVLVSGSTFSRHIPGPNFGEDKYDGPQGKTDKSGTYVVDIPSLTGEIGIGLNDTLMRVAGYYKTATVIYRGQKVEHNRWQPWNPTLTIKLQRIINPIPMYAKQVETKIPEYDKPCGYDLMEGDWVAPYGKGKNADLVFAVSNKLLGGKDRYGRDHFEAKFSVGFSNQGDGVLEYPVVEYNRGLRMPYQAPDVGYVPSLSDERYSRPGEQPNYGSFDCKAMYEQNYFIRVRTIQKDGKIEYALYGKIQNRIEWYDTRTLRFTYYLNPTPNDRNIEFDPDKNLFGRPSCKVGSDQSMNVRQP